jgi:hypothetical protein
MAADAVAVVCECGRISRPLQTPPPLRQILLTAWFETRRYSALIFLRVLNLARRVPTPTYPATGYCTFDLNWQLLNNWGSLFLGPCPWGSTRYTGIVYGTLDPMGGAINYLSLVVALVKAEK